MAMNRLLKVRPSVHTHSPAHAETVSAEGMDLITLSTLHSTRRAIVMADDSKPEMGPVPVSAWSALALL